MIGDQPSSVSRKRSQRKPTASEVRNLFLYNEETGDLIWRRNKNRARAGQVAGYFDKKQYRDVMIDGRNYKAHRLIWVLKTGEWPPDQIDHKDGNPSNNRWDNLRLATNQQNHANRRRNKNNTTGYRHVVYRKDRPKSPWHARITVNGRDLYCGSFVTPEEAAARVQQVHKEIFGEFSSYA